MCSIVNDYVRADDNLIDGPPCVMKWTVRDRWMLSPIDGNLINMLASMRRRDRFHDGREGEHANHVIA